MTFLPLMLRACPERSRTGTEAMSGAIGSDSLPLACAGQLRLSRTQRIDTPHASFIMNPGSGGPFATRQDARRNQAHPEDLLALPLPGGTKPDRRLRDHNGG